jgi:RND family efflux transporter MFP subunit
VRLGLWGLGVVLLIVLGLIVGALPRMAARREIQQQARQLGTPTVLVTVPSHSPAGSDLMLPAEVKPFVEAAIFARANGYLKRWAVDLGARVEPGQLLAEIDTPELDQDLARAGAERKRAEAALSLARTTADRWRELLKSSSVSEQETAEKEADLALKVAGLESVMAEEHRIRETLSFARVTAPFAGVITERHADVGQLINTSGNRELFRLADTGRLRVFARVPQSAASAMKPGTEAELHFPEMPRRTFPAKVVRNAGAMDPTTRTLLTELDVDNSKGEILAGSFAQVRFRDRTADVLLTIPSNTLLFGAEGVRAAVVGSDNRIQMRKLKLGRDFGPTVEILEGVEIQDRLVLNPPDSISAGTEVKIITPSNPAPPKP